MGLAYNNINWVVSPNSFFQDCQSEKDLFEKVIFIETQHMHRPYLQLDTIDIYRLKQPPYESFMRSQRTFQYDSPKLIEFQSTLRKLSQIIIHKNITPVQFIKINQQNNMCMRSVKIDYFAAYYGIELRDIVQNRKSQDFRFDQGEILYVAKSLISLGTYLQNQNISFGLFKSKNIFISDNGYIKTYLFHMLAENKHINYFNLLASKPSNLSLHLPIAPQMFSDLQQNNLTPSFDVFKADLFQIGMVLADMIVESSLQRYYRFGKEGMNFDQNKLAKDLDELKFKQVYHPKILYLLQMILQTQPQNRWTFQIADKYLDYLKKDFQFAYRLNLYNGPSNDDEETQLKNKISFKFDQPESQYVLQSIQNSLESKLHPFPLKSLAKTTINKTKQTKKPTKQQNYIHIKDYQGKESFVPRQMFTKRRSTGVSIISSSSRQNNNRSFSRNQNKSSKLSTIRNSRIGDKLMEKNCKEEVTDFNQKISTISKHLNDYGEHVDGWQQKLGQNWLTLGSTRITEENNKTLNFLPPKGIKSLKSNPMIHLNHMSRQNVETTGRKHTSSSSISTHIKLHKKSTISTKEIESQISGINKVEYSQQWKENLPFNKSQVQSSQKSIYTVRSKMKLNHHFRA